MTTTRPQPIVAGIDGSRHSLRALDWATREAAVRQRPLRIVHAFLWPLTNDLMGPPGLGTPDAGLQRAAESVLSAAADRAHKLAPAVDISTDLPANTPAAALIDASHDAALVVVGHRGLGGFAGLLVGSVGVQVAAHAACPVVVVRGSDPDSEPDNGLGNGPGEAGAAAGHVVVGVDGSDLSSLAVDFAFAHAALHGLGVVAVHAYQLSAFAAAADPRLVIYDVDRWRGDQTRLLTDALAGYGDKYPDVPVHQKVVYGASADVLVAASAGAALTVVGSRGRGGFTGLLLGSTSQSLLHHATGPVAIVRAHPSQHGGATPRPRRHRRNAPHPARPATSPATAATEKRQAAMPPE
jgi:nucleotide-binding universal stress UspA family protein